ncbi:MULTISPECIES: CGNR zinc finger domain-containing protein [Nonomuraea]|uniref:CGNR zinc finger domain-containing protein n=1 Tax=Nonomuraea mangrovi TaxID=2316207 RepID=A0ABW4SVM2_9ACTN
MNRPLLGEPLPLDLVDTHWVERDAWVDFLDDPADVRRWLEGHGLPAEDETARERLVEVRAAMRAVLEESDASRLNAVLDHGARRPRLRGAEPYEELVLDDPSFHAAWVVAESFVNLLRERPERVRKCANPACVLWFADVSKNGRRRWCSMEGCGNRAKVGRFNQRARDLRD